MGVDVGRENTGNDRAIALLRLLWLIWLPFLAYPVTGFYRSYPLSQLMHAHTTPIHRAAMLAGAALFLGIYAWTTWRNCLSHGPAVARTMRRPTPPWIPLCVLVAVPVALIALDRKEWLTLFILTSASMGARLPTAPAAWAVAGLVLLTAVAGWVAGSGWPVIGPTLFLVGFVGVVVISLVRVVAIGRELRAAREELARLAVAEERLRFARDLHDLLGHNLSRIALQSEVAEVLVPATPERAIATMREVGQVARTALQEVRAAVAGYRQPSLDAELRGAAEILAAAGIALRREGGEIAVPPSVEAALAWAVREGVTNVVRHSRATRCTIRLRQEDGRIALEVIDDGIGAGPPSAASESGGSGLPGLAERIAAIGGRCSSGSVPDGGFRLLVTVPASAASGAGAGI